MTVTIRDVAEAAGVSVATASRALLGTRRVSPVLVVRVEAAAAKLGYRRNAVAGALRSKRSGTVGFVVPEISNPFFPTMVEAVEHHLQKTDRQLLLGNSRGDSAIEALRVRALLERQIDGLLISPCDFARSGEIVAEVARALPVVQIDRQADGVQSDWVGVDDEAGISAVVQHLSSLGAQRFAYIGSKETSSSASARLAAFSHSVRKHRTSGHDRDIFLGEFTTDWGSEAAGALLADPPLPDCIVCGNDAIAFGVLRRLRVAEIRVPQQVMVTGFDDTPFAEIFDPPLTTVRQPQARMAAEAIRLLDQAMAHPGHSATEKVAIAPTLIVRATTRG